MNSYKRLVPGFEAPTAIAWSTRNRSPLVRVPAHLVLAGRVVGLLSGLTRSLETRTDLVRALLPYALSATRPRPPRA